MLLRLSRKDWLKKQIAECDLLLRLEPSSSDAEVILLLKADWQEQLRLLIERNDDGEANSYCC